jgi:hypothetical protein
MPVLDLARDIFSQESHRGQRLPVAPLNSLNQIFPWHSDSRKQTNGYRPQDLTLSHEPRMDGEETRKLHIL